MLDPEAFAAAHVVAGLLDTLKVPYAIGGSVASMAHGMLRTTMDIDLVADLAMEHVTPFVTALSDQFYVDEPSVRQAIERRSSFNVIHLPTMVKVDVFLPRDRPFDQQQLSRRLAQRMSPDSGETLWVLTPEDVILAKLDWFRMGGEVSERQWRDILGVMKTQREMLDMTYLQQWAEQLDVADLLARAREEMAAE
jgi:hypothetical protein